MNDLIPTNNVVELQEGQKKNLHYPFWFSKDSGVTINRRKLVRFLAEQGFGKFKTINDRTSNNVLFKNEDGVLQTHDSNSVKRWVNEFVENDDTLSEESQSSVLDKWISIAPSSLQNYLESLPIYSESDFNDTKKIKMFRDSSDECYVSFRNGVVRITKNDVELVPKDALKDKGCIWESAVLPHNISVEDKYMRTKSSPFKDFVAYALKNDVEPIDGENDVSLGTQSKRYKDELEGFETAFGYLIHSYNPPDESKIVVFIDVDSSPERTEGGNGKSLSMEMLKHYRSTAFVDGKGFRKALNDSSRFNFSNVKLDTGFVFINDLNPDFELKQMFSIITDDMTIEGKGTNKVTIPKDKKPKMGITTNHVITGIGGSYERRQHIVEFGNFWNKCNSSKISPKDILGKLIGEDFNEDDWNSFYNYGFHCIQKYLQKGLCSSDGSNFRRKQLIASIEGVNGTGEVLEWIEDWVLSDNASEGQPLKVVHNQFIKDYPLLNEQWNTTNFKTALFEFASSVDGLEYNYHLKNKGNTCSSRRWRKGERGNQEEWVKIEKVS